MGQLERPVCKWGALFTDGSRFHMGRNIYILTRAGGVLSVTGRAVLTMTPRIPERNNYWLQNVFGCHLIAQYFVILLV